MVACQRKNDLSKAEATKIIAKERGYPQTIDFDVFCSAPVQATKLYKAGLEEDGFIRVEKTLKLGDVGSRIITFTDQAKPYFLPTAEKDLEIDVQKVLMGKIVLKEISGLLIEDGVATVEFMTTFEEPTPFSKLINVERHRDNKHTIYLKNTAIVWREVNDLIVVSL